MENPSEMIIDRLTADCVAFLQRLIQTPSMSGEEAAIANLIAEEMRQLQFDEVWIDEVGNACGRIFGRDRDLPCLVLNTHLDHVDPGDPHAWTVPPFSGAIADGWVIGRGAVDIKGPLATQIYAMAGLRRLQQRPQRDILFTGVVEEEIGGKGALHWAENLDYPVELLILGEPSSNNLSLGHRGILGLWVTFHGRSVHASVPQSGNNPNYALAAFLSRLQTAQEDLSTHDLLGKTTVAPTIVEVDTKSMNVTPAWSRVLLDFRTSSESPRSLKQFINSLAGSASHSIAPGYDARDDTDSKEVINGFYTPPDHNAVIRMRSLLTEGMGRTPELTNYRFATDGRHFVGRGFPVVGYAPGDASQAHVADESITIQDIEESLRGHLQLLANF